MLEIITRLSAISGMFEAIPAVLKLFRSSFEQTFWDKMGQDLSSRDSQVVENMVELVGLEPTTSSLRTMRSPN